MLTAHVVPFSTTSQGPFFLLRERCSQDAEMMRAPAAGTLMGGHTVSL